MNTQTFIQMTEEDLHTVFFSIAKEKAEVQIYNRYYGVLVPASWVAKIHGVSYQTVFNYIKRGMISPVERGIGTENYQFRLSDVLKMDFNLLRKQFRNINK